MQFDEEYNVCYIMHKFNPCILIKKNNNNVRLNFLYKQSDVSETRLVKRLCLMQTTRQHYKTEIKTQLKLKIIFKNVIVSNGLFFHERCCLKTLIIIILKKISPIREFNDTLFVRNRNWISFTKVLCAKFGWHWYSGSGDGRHAIRETHASFQLR